ncbi:hypothetical protein ILUMI_12105 [Ignelater luminosus]|uniref:HAT C-terminal dimerisation domain-containing protein n=1 Tax=Ignelater luminosus TaxID=2038154 RepID=A0A8K0G9V6_IGNLU|nr:hypothetical protein ILUMI_12105 [Ignelater luminosus]
MQTWVDLDKMLKSETTVNSQKLRLLEAEKTIGSSKKLFHHGNGNSLKAIEMISTVDAVIREHVEHVEKKVPHYLGEIFTFEVITGETENESGIDGLELFNELKQLKLFSLPCYKLQDPLDVLQYLLENDPSSVFPNLIIALRILLTLAVSVASSERSFSKLKLIKDYPRSTMLQERLSGLAILAIECETLEEIKTEGIIKEYATVKSRRKI